MELITERLVLREVTEEDYNFIYELDTNEFIQKFEMDAIPTKEEIDIKFSKILESIDRTPRTKYTLIICRLSDYNPIGRVVMWEIDSSIREWEIGWDVHPDFIGNGYAPEASKSLIGFAFNELGVHRVQALCNDSNVNSEKVMIKIGMKKEGTCRGVRFLNNCWHGSHIYSLLDSDFNN
jgi:ribosomal-protein-alanine N-acetyltransferase